MNGPLGEMFRYNRWANETQLLACASLTDEQLDRPIPGVIGGAPTVRQQLLHVVGGQQTFVLRTKGRQHEGELNRDSPWPGFGTLLAVARQTSGELIDIAEALETDEDVVLPYLGVNYTYPKAFFLVHAMEHAAEHRAEVKLALGAAGIETPDLDGWAYAAAMGYGGLRPA